MVFGRIRKKLKHKEVYGVAMRDWIWSGVEQMCSQNLQTQELSHMTTVMSEDYNLAAEMLFATKQGMQENPELATLCKTQWSQYVKAYNVAVSIPKSSGTGSDIFLVAAYEDPWAALTEETALDGVYDTVAVDFYEDVKQLIARRARGL